MHLIKLKFFGMGKYGERSISELEDMLIHAPESYRVLYNEMLQQRGREKQSEKENKVKNYFNFDEFSKKQFNEFVDDCITKHKSGSIMSIDDALKLAQNAPQRTYIVIFSSVGKVCHIGKTEQPLSYIGLQHKKIEQTVLYLRRLMKDILMIF